LRRAYDYWQNQPGCYPYPGNLPFIGRQHGGLSPERFPKGPIHTHGACGSLPQSQVACPSVGSLCQASYQQACTLLQNLLVPSPMKIEASPMHSPGRLAEVLLGTPRKVDHSCVLFMLHTITEYRPGTSARVDPATALSNPVELHIVKYAEQIRGPTAHHAPWLPVRLGMLLHH